MDASSTADLDIEPILPGERILRLLLDALLALGKAFVPRQVSSTFTSSSKRLAKY